VLVVTIDNPAPYTASLDLTTGVLTVSGFSPLDAVVLRFTDSSGPQTVTTQSPFPDSVTADVTGTIASGTIQVSVNGGLTFQCVPITTLVQAATIDITSCGGVGIGSATLTGLPPNSTGTLILEPLSGATILLQVTTDALGTATVNVGLCTTDFASAAVAFDNGAGVITYLTIQLVVP
jgi:hypothetical protein